MPAKRILILLLSIALVATTQISWASEAKPAYASPDGRQVPHGHWQFFFTPSFLLPISYQPEASETRAREFTAVLPPCSGNQEACIARVEYQLNSGPWFDASAGPDEGQRALKGGYLNGANNWVFQKSSTYKEDVSLGRPEGATARMWKFAQAPHAASDSYQVAVQFKGNVSTNGTFETTSFNVEIVPATRVPGSAPACMQPSIWEERAQYSQDGYCKTIYDFPANLNVKITVKLGSFLDKVQGWFDGRLKDASIMVDSSNKSIEIQGSPLTVPSAAIRPIKYEEIPRNYGGAPEADVIATQNVGSQGTAGMGDANNEFILNNFITMTPDILPNAIGENTVWKISSMKTPLDKGCLQPGVVNGLVITNATVYNASAPTWNSQRGSLDFRVAATHYDSHGEVLKGYYKMLVSEEVAKCYWGEDFSRGTASISITNPNGSPDIATTNLGLQDGWMNFEAAGFTFSAPIISAIIKKAPVVVTTPTPTPTPTPVKKTIKCKSGRKITKVTALKPVCPKGTKKVA
jgi:hypothetical protein